MNKILELLEKAGVKKELASSIGESLEQYKTSLKEQFEADFTAKVEQAKKICIEETEAHKRELARRFEVFLETKYGAIEAAFQKQAAVHESEAVTKLKDVKSLLEGIMPTGQDGAANTGKIATALEKAQHQIKQLTEERDQAVAKANKQNGVAETVLAWNRQLVAENARLRSNINQTRPVTEGKLDTRRATQQPVTTRPTLVENQDRRPAKATAAGQTAPASARNGFNVADIASVMDADLI